MRCAMGCDGRITVGELEEMRRRRLVAVQIETGQTRVSYGTERVVLAGVLVDELRLIEEVERMRRDEGNNGARV
jgi:hypothetical protein